MGDTKRKNIDSRIEFRVSQADKELFEYASTLRGFKSFSEFARVIITKEARAIVAEEKQILASKRDQQIFFKALMGKEDQPNDNLLSAIDDYNKLTSK